MAEALLDQSNTIEGTHQTFRTIVETGGLNKLPQYLDEIGLSDGQAFVITDTNVERCYGDRVSESLNAAGIHAETLVIAANESNKTLGRARQLIEELAARKANSDDTILALGGGVVGDLAGFSASIYHSGMPLVQLPTTLLAMVDSSIGGKTAVDHGGKNKIGTFYHPKLVVADPSVLLTLDRRVYTEGLGEVARYAALDERFFGELEYDARKVRELSPFSYSAVCRIIARCVKQKSDIVVADPEERSIDDGRVLLNYGHTLAHGLEAAGDYTELLHGEGVSIGMTYAAQLAVRLGIAEQSFAERQTGLLRSLGLPIRYEGKADIEDIMRYIARDKKNTSLDNTRFVLPESVGHMTVRLVDNDIVRSTVSEFLAG